MYKISAGDQGYLDSLSYQSHLGVLFTGGAAATEKVDGEVDDKFDDLYERQQRHSEEQTKTSTNVGQERVSLETHEIHVSLYSHIQIHNAYAYMRYITNTFGFCVTSAVRWKIEI